MKAIKLSIFAATMLVAGITSVKAQDAEEILKKHEKAVGGLENWDKVKTVKKTGSISVQGMDIPVIEYLANNKGMRVEFTFMGQTGFQIITTKAGYSFQPGQTKVDTLKPEMVKMAGDQLDVKTSQFLNYKSIGTKAEFAGKDSVDSSPCYKIKFTTRDGEESVAYFDVNSYYLLRVETKVKQDDQEQEVATSFKDYKKLPEGIIVPMSETSPMGEMVMKSVEINKPIDEKLFVPTMPSADGK